MLLHFSAVVLTTQNAVENTLVIHSPIVFGPTALRPLSNNGWHISGLSPFAASDVTAGAQIVFVRVHKLIFKMDGCVDR